MRNEQYYRWIELIQYAYYINMLLEDLGKRMKTTLDDLTTELVTLESQLESMVVRSERPLPSPHE